MNIENDFSIGLLWGIVFSIPLWISIIGWVKLFI
jgi:hypothetical protein